MGKIFDNSKIPVCLTGGFTVYNGTSLKGHISIKDKFCGPLQDHGNTRQPFYNTKSQGVYYLEVSLYGQNFD